MKDKTKKEPSYGNFPPPSTCTICNGRGEVKDQLVGFLSYHWTYKKCISCEGTGKNLWSCIWCEGLVNRSGVGDFWCPNEKCEKYALIVALAFKKK